MRKDIQNVYVTGTAATDTYSMMGNYYGISDHYSTYLQGIVSKVSDGTNVNYKPAYTIVPTRDVNPGNYATATKGSPYWPRHALHGDTNQLAVMAITSDFNHQHLP